MAVAVLLSLLLPGRKSVNGGSGRCDQRMRPPPAITQAPSPLAVAVFLVLLSPRTRLKRSVVALDPGGVIGVAGAAVAGIGGAVVAFDRGPVVGA